MKKSFALPLAALSLACIGHTLFAEQKGEAVPIVEAESAPPAGQEAKVKPVVKKKKGEKKPAKGDLPATEEERDIPG
ncbi:MAG: hypothetical protein OXF02_04830 [Simkaniaceae bacterium]|nr:hypothetical protein [Simkaniaceae bacterium]